MRLWRFLHLLAIWHSFRYAWFMSRERIRPVALLWIELEKARSLWRSLRVAKTDEPPMTTRITSADLRRIRERLMEMAS